MEGPAIYTGSPGHPPLHLIILSLLLQHLTSSVKCLRNTGMHITEEASGDGWRTCLVQASFLHFEKHCAVIEAEPCRVPGHDGDIVPKSEQDQPLQRRKILLVRCILGWPVIVNVCQKYVVLDVLLNLIRILQPWRTPLSQ
jgi:hypothetical protein